MKQSNYNYIVEKDNNIYCFNGLSFLYFKINKNQQALLKDILSDEEYKTRIPSFYEKMVQGGFIIDDTTDEVELIRKKNKEAQETRTCMLVILPTFDCNFNCWYCIQKHEKNAMTKDTIEKTKTYIKRLVQSKKIDCLYIDWFGGEPFLYFNEVMELILAYAQSICDENKIDYFTCATTNGFLIKDEIVDKLEHLNFKNLYITLDGDKEHHDINRIAKKGSSFDTILENVNTICNKTSDLKISLRINYDENNLCPDELFRQVETIISKQNQSKITFTLRKIWQAKKVKGTKAKLNHFIAYIKSTDFNFDFSGDLIMNFSPCYAAQKNMKLITPNGIVGKCSAKEDFETSPMGYISEEGIVIWNQNLPIDEIYSKPLFENERCLACKYLPVCMGPCPNNLNLLNPDSNEFNCKGRVNDFSFDDAIFNYCEFNELMEK